MKNAKINCILLVDDDSITNYINQRLIKKLGVSDTIVVANSGEKGLEYIEEFSRLNNFCAPELIFIDVNMPGLKGFDFLKEYDKIPLANKDKVRIFMVTATSDNLQKVKEKHQEFDVPYLTKPLTLETLQKVLDLNPVE